MHYSLSNHERTYQLSWKESLLATGTLSGIPYAKRHWELSNQDSSHRLGHRIIAILEAIPIFGALAALIERISALAYAKFSHSNAISTDNPRANRRYPPVSLVDTIIVENGKIKSVHGHGDLFSNSEILKVHQVLQRKLLDGGVCGMPEHLLQKMPYFSEFNDDVYVEFTKNQKAIIQQQAVRGCTAAVAAMLIVDHGKSCDINELRRRNLGNTEDICRDIENAGLQAKVTYVSVKDDLNNIVQQGNSAIVTIDGEIGGHVIIVDEIKANKARVRDPYHGWEITITKTALLKRFTGGDVIQIAQ